MSQDTEVLRQRLLDFEQKLKSKYINVSSDIHKNGAYFWRHHGLHVDGGVSLAQCRDEQLWRIAKALPWIVKNLRGQCWTPEQSIAKAERLLGEP